jgi:hypothetical protein
MFDLRAKSAARAATRCAASAGRRDDDLADLGQ